MAHSRIPHRPWLLGMAVLACASAGLMLAAATALAQTNFAPLEQGEYEEDEDRVLVIKGVEANLKYAFRLHDLSAGDASGDIQTTRLDQDLRLDLSTNIHRDLSVHLVLETFQEPISEGNIREQPEADRDRTADSGDLAIHAREAYLRYFFNPNSALTFGKQELAIADRKGLVYAGIAPAVHFDCTVGTWCMPFGGIKVNENTADWLYHWGLTYTAWDDRPPGELPSSLRVGLFRYYYSEQGIPLARNNGPGYFNPDDPTTPIEGQQTDDAGNPIYYDITDHDIFGLNVDWEGGALFGSLNFANSQGERNYHLYRADVTGLPEMQFDTEDPVKKRQKKINGWVLHAELGYKWRPRKLGLVGFRWLHATGDPDRGNRNNGASFLRGMSGYYEVTPGSYSGTRLWFNGSDASVDGGAGFGHSVNNTRMYGLFLEAHDPDSARAGYSGGFYYLKRIHSVLDTKDKKQDYIGMEWDNMLTWYFHNAAKVQFELNLMEQGGAFAYSDFETPDREKHLIVQTIARIVYEF
jgi:hypothetical protein